jgi:hypothetical protein
MRYRKESGRSPRAGRRTDEAWPETLTTFGRGALLPLNDVELDDVALGQALEALRLDRGVMDEAVLLTTVRRDESEALRVVEPRPCRWCASFCSCVLEVIG